MYKCNFFSKLSIETYEITQLDAAIKALYRGATVQLRELNGNLVQLPHLPQLKKRLWHAATVFTRAQQSKIDAYNDKVFVEQQRIVTEIQEKYGKYANTQQPFVKEQCKKTNVTHTRLLQTLNTLKLDDLKSSQQFIDLGVKAVTQITALINSAPIELLEILYNELAPAYGFQTGSFSLESAFNYYLSNDTGNYFHKTEVFNDFTKNTRNNLSKYIVNPVDVILVFYYQFLNEEELIGLDAGNYTCICGNTVSAETLSWCYSGASFMENFVRRYLTYYKKQMVDDDNVCPYCGFLLNF